MDEYWTKDMFPIFDFGGDFHLINLNSNSPSFGQIFFYASGLEFDSMISIYDNLDSCIHSIIDCYQKNIYFLNEDGFIDKDIQVELSVGTRFNPNSEYWKFYTQYF
jgi:hypothetical protein